MLQRKHAPYVFYRTYKLHQSEHSAPVVLDESALVRRIARVYRSDSMPVA